MNAGLCVLALRRALAPAVLVAWALLLAVVLGPGRADAGTIDAASGAIAGSEPTAIARGLAREGAWVAVLIGILPLLVVRAARLVPRWRAGEGDWLGSRALGRPAIAASTFVGTFAGAAGLLAATCAVIELSTGEAGSTLRRSGSIPLPAAAWITPETPLVVTVPSSKALARSTPGDLDKGTRARVELAFGDAAGSAAEIVLLARRSDREIVRRARLATHGTVEVELPLGEGPLEIVITAPLAGSRAYLVTGEIELWTPEASERAGSRAVIARLLPAVLAWIALAFGLGAWMSAASATWAVVAAWTAIWLSDARPAWLPGADLWEALDTVGAGRVPAHADVRSLGVALLFAFVGLCLVVLGTRRWRAEP
jgi:hypothetical protein